MPDAAAPVKAPARQTRGVRLPVRRRAPIKASPASIVATVAGSSTWPATQTLSTTPIEMELAVYVGADRKVSHF